MNDNQDPALQLNTLIASCAVQGKAGDYLMAHISWQTVGRYLVAYIEDYDETTYRYRVFRYPEAACYEEQRVLNPSYEDDKYECLYDSVERGTERTQLHFARGNWAEELFALCKAQ